MNSQLPFISEHDRQALQALVQNLREKTNDDVRRVILFGSKARGDAGKESDIDIMVILNREEWALEHQVLTLGARTSLDYEVLFNMFTLSSQRWNWMKEINHPLYRNIQKDGIELLSKPIAE